LQGVCIRLIGILGKEPSERQVGAPIAWGGPIVKNTEEELELAFREYRDSTFIKG
jgi:hypothetical protein